MRFLIVLFMMMASQHALADGYNVGTRKITTETEGVEVAIRLFYPTQQEAVETRFGPWLISVARNSAPSTGKFPLVVISHGLGGNDWNHHLLASSLARDGFVVAAVQHPDDLLRVGRPEITVLRPRELSAAIDATLGNEHFADHVDPEKTGAFGFSLGGFTVLAAAGGKTEYKKIAQHCRSP